MTQSNDLKSMKIKGIKVFFWSGIYMRYPCAALHIHPFSAAAAGVKFSGKAAVASVCGWIARCTVSARGEAERGKLG